MSNPAEKHTKLFFRDGTSQHDRLLKALDPSFVSVEERSTQDLLKFVRQFSRHLRYFRADGGVDESPNQSTWEPFFSYDAREIAELLDQPEHSDAGQGEYEPHLALLYAFLKLLHYPRQQFDSLTERHLEYYYKHVLGLIEKPAVPDQVHVLFELAKKEEEQLLTKRTLLSGGKDSSGKELIYATAVNSIINRAKVSDIRTLHVGKQWTFSKITVLDPDNGRPAKTETFRPFGETVETGLEASACTVGFAVTSPLLLLDQGERTITLTLVCEEESLVRDKIDASLFYVALSSNGEWLNLSPEYVSVAVVNFPMGASPEDNALQFTLKIDKSHPALTPLASGEGQRPPLSPWPAIMVKPKHDAADTAYDLFKSIRCEQIHLAVTVEDAPVPFLRNDNTVLKAKSPFEPFGSRPGIGSGFYFTADELCRKKIDSLDLHLEWMGLPADFAAHYLTYCESPILNKVGEIENSSFKARLSLYNNGLWLEQKGFAVEQDLFADEGGALKSTVTLNFTNLDVPQPREQVSSDDDAADPFERSRYFKLELSAQDFQHEIYPMVVNWAAVQSAASIAKDDPVQHIVYPPYTPKVKSFTIGYSASDDLVFPLKDIGKKVKNRLQLYHLHPFGYSEIVNGTSCTGEEDSKTEKNPPLLFPQFAGNGYLHIGISDLKPNQEVSLLFQVVAGSAEVSQNMPKLSWQYLAVDGWKTMTSADILEDSTSGLLDSGIIRIHVPDDATDQATLMPAGRFWFRLVGDGPCRALADIIDIRPQAVRAVFIDHGNADDHLGQPLAAGTITALKDKNPAIKGVTQPYSSFDGRKKEHGQLFFRRISERLRHGDRALTSWDYERLVLDQFPEIYKVKCLSRSILDGYEETNPGTVRVVVIPDISHAAPFFPLAPRAPLYLLDKIERHLMQRTPPAVTVQVRNPRYEQIQYRIGVQFKEGCQSGYYLKKINEDIKRYLSPWAYEGNAEIPLGSSISNAALINYLDGLDYVDFISHLKLVNHRMLGRGGEEDEQYPISDSHTVHVQRPDAILVSAPDHIIDFASDEDEGIGYMVIGTDFIIS